MTLYPKYCQCGGRLTLCLPRPPRESYWRHAGRVSADRARAYGKHKAEPVYPPTRVESVETRTKEFP